MFDKLFRKKSRAIEAPKIAVVDPDLLYNAFQAGLDRMEEQGVHRIVLTINEIAPVINNQFISVSPYEPFQVLDEREQELIKSNKPYKVISLQSALAKNCLRGLCIHTRTPISMKFIAKMVPGTIPFYNTSGGFLTDQSLRDFSRDNSAYWTPEIVNDRITEGTAEYRSKTRELMGKVGVFVSLDSLGTI